MAVDPFAVAKVKPVGIKKSSSPIIVAKDFINPFTRTTDATREDVVQAMQEYAKGDAYVKEGQAMVAASKDLLVNFGRAEFAQLWCHNGQLPENPKFVENPDGSGVMYTMTFQDRATKMGEQDLLDLGEIIGKSNVSKYTSIHKEFTLNSEILDNMVVVWVGKKAVEKKVMEHISDALTEKFKDNPEVLENLFTMKPICETKKGLIDDALKLVGANSAKLVEFLVKARVVNSFKLGKMG